MVSVVFVVWWEGKGEGGVRNGCVERRTVCVEVSGVCGREGEVRGEVVVDQGAHHVVHFMGFGVEGVVDIEKEDRTGVGGG